MRQQVYLGQVSAAGLLLTVATLFYGRVFDGPTWLPSVLGAVLLSGLLALVLGRSSMPGIFRALALTFTGGLYVLLAIILPSTDFAGFEDVADAFYGAEKAAFPVFCLGLI